MKLRYYSAEAVAWRHEKVPDLLDWYGDPTASLPEIDRLLKPVRESDIDVRGLENLELQPSSTEDATNAIAIYQAFHQLTPQEAADERLWCYLCHHRFSLYVSRRWSLKVKEEQDSEEAYQEKKVKNIRNHFFVRGNRGLIRDNGISRLWWLGRIASMVDPKNPLNFLEVIYHKQDIRSALIERPSVAMNLTILKAVYQVMKKHRGGVAEMDSVALFERDTFREWMKRINRRGGVLVLDALRSKDLSQLLSAEAEKALAANPKGKKERGN